MPDAPPHTAEPRPRFSVLLVNYNGLDWTTKALDSVALQRHSSVEAIVADSGSTDGSPEVIEAWIAAHRSLPAKLLRFSQNIGFAAGCNRAFEASRGELIVLLNNDAEMQPGVLERVEVAARAHPEAGSFMCSMRFTDAPDTINSAGIVAFWDGSAMDRCWKRPIAENPSEFAEVLGPCGGAAVWRREVIERVGFLDEEFFMYGEDVDFALRARRAGYACLYLPEAVVLHKGSLTAARAPKLALMRIQYRNVPLTLMRNLPPLARARGWLMYFARFATGLGRYGWRDTWFRALALSYALRHRRRLGRERRAIRALGPDERVLTWTFLRESDHP